MLAGPVTSANHMLQRSGDMVHGTVSWFGRQIQWFKDLLASFWHIVRPHTLADFVGKYPKECTAIALLTSIISIALYRSFFTGHKRKASS